VPPSRDVLHSDPVSYKKRTSCNSSVVKRGLNIRNREMGHGGVWTEVRV
jgi:hypothetical protein